jgi:Flp pilus assembly protein TadD
MRFGSSLRHFSLAALFTACLAGSALAQVGRVGGIVRDEKGDPIKGAIISAENSSIASSFTATTDEKGRFTMVGLRPGGWRFMAQANGHAAQAGEMNVRWGSPNPPMTFTLKRTGPGTTGTLAGVDAKDLQAELAVADQLFNQRKWDEAIASYRKIIAKTPSLSVINLQIAAAFRNKKDFDSAIDSYNALLTADPNNEQAKVGIALTNLESGDAKAAEAALQEAANNPAAGRDVLFNLGEVKSTAGDIAEAEKWYARASAVDPSWGKPLHRLGMLALQKGDKSGAAKYLNQVMSVDPVSAEAALARATLDQLNR